jgi:hypothetical protein
MPARCDYRTMAPFSMMILRRVHVHTRTSLTYVCCIQDTCADLRTKASPSVRGMDWTDGLDWCFGLQSGLVTTSPVRNPSEKWKLIATKRYVAHTQHALPMCYVAPKSPRVLVARMHMCCRWSPGGSKPHALQLLIHKELGHNLCLKVVGNHMP